MPRKRRLKVVGYPDFVEGRTYRMRVQRVCLEQGGAGLAVACEHLAEEQQGRNQDLRFPLPVRPYGRTAAFFRACGMEVSVDVDIVYEDAADKIIDARFEPTPGLGDWEPVPGELPDRETRDDPKPV